jgi:hypothetical protein
VQQAIAAAIAVADHIGLFYCLNGLHGCQARMTWSNANKPDPTHATMPMPHPGHGETD